MPPTMWRLSPLLRPGPPQTRDVEYEFGGRQIRIWGRVFRLFDCKYGEIQPQIFPYLRIRAVFGVPASDSACDRGLCCAGAKQVAVGVPFAL